MAQPHGAARRRAQPLPRLGLCCSATMVDHSTTRPSTRASVSSLALRSCSIRWVPAAYAALLFSCRKELHAVGRSTPLRALRFLYRRRAAPSSGSLWLWRRSSCAGGFPLRGNQPLALAGRGRPHRLALLPRAAPSATPSSLADDYIGTVVNFASSVAAGRGAAGRAAAGARRVHDARAARALRLRRARAVDPAARRALLLTRWRSSC